MKKKSVRVEGASSENRTEKDRTEKGKEEICSKSLYVVSILKNTQAEKEALANPETRVLDGESQRPHLTFVLMESSMHGELMKKYPSEVGARGKKFRINSD